MGALGSYNSSEHYVLPDGGRSVFVIARRARNERICLVKPSTLFLFLWLGLFTTAAWAALKPGDAAPDFTVDAALGGKEFKFSLAEALKKGPVVLYFYPKSFTSVCTVEAHEFAENIENFAAASARVGPNLQISSNVACVSALIGLKLELPQSFVHISARTSLTTGALNSAFPKASETRRILSLFDPSISASEKRLPSCDG